MHWFILLPTVKAALFWCWTWAISGDLSQSGSTVPSFSKPLSECVFLLKSNHFVEWPLHLVCQDSITNWMHSDFSFPPETVLIIKLRLISHSETYKSVQLVHQSRLCQEKKKKEGRRERIVSKIAPFHICTQQANNHQHTESVLRSGINIAFYWNPWHVEGKQSTHLCWTHFT